MISGPAIPAILKIRFKLMFIVNNFVYIIPKKKNTRKVIINPNKVAMSRSPFITVQMSG